MTIIYLDTNIILNESYFRSSFSQAFLKACALLEFQVVIPDIVIDEVLGNYSPILKAKLKSLQKIHKEVGRLVDLKDIDMAPADDAFSDYEDFFYDLIDSHGVDIAPYPDISPKDLVKRSYKRDKPFKDTGDGYKDFLVWQSIVSHIQKNDLSSPIYFLTNNTKDFGEQDGDGKHVLHTTLRDQLKDAKGHPVLITAMRDAWDMLLVPHLQGMTAEDIPDLSADDIRDFVIKFLLADLPGHATFGYVGLPFSNDVSIVLVGAENISETTYTKIENEVLVNVVGTVELEVSGFIEKHAYYQSLEDPDAPDIYVTDGDWNDHVMLVGAMINTAFDIKMFYSLDDRKIVGYEVSLPEEIEADWY